MPRPTPSCLLTAATLTAVAVALGGCYGYSSWPPVEGNTAINDVNFTPTPVVMAVAMKFVADRYPPVPDPMPGQVYDVPFTISLPPGASVHTYYHVVESAGPAAHPLIEGQPELPLYTVAGVNVRGTSATVDIIRPVVGVGGKAIDKTLYQGVTVYLSSGVSPWHVTFHRTMPIGMMEVPPPNPLPAGAAKPYSSAP
ncbi:MAG: hypothetical protein ACREJO_01975 [Phycisphaerales bacterium]